MFKGKPTKVIITGEAKEEFGDLNKVVGEEIAKGIARILSSTVMETQVVTMPKREYEQLKQQSEVDHELLTKLVRGLEDIKAGRVKPWRKHD
ncbi:hypothetical protein HYU12_03585 [Candidatus Woesearchaeota archaeon]|nr:hypothetical protein [Candidatus Woesearchaeota archaeon]